MPATTPLNKTLRTVLLASGVLFASASQAELYKCKDAAGQLVYQQIPCTEPGRSSGVAGNAGRSNEGRPGAVRSYCTDGNTVQCRAAMRCMDEGAVGPTLSSCIARTQQRLQAEEAQARNTEEAKARVKQRDQALLQEQEIHVSVKKAPVAAAGRSPMDVIQAGQYWDTDALAKTLDSYRGVKYTPVFIIIPHGGAVYELRVVKRNNTDVPAIYLVQSIKMRTEGAR